VSLSTDVAREFKESQRVIASLQKKLMALEKQAETQNRSQLTPTPAPAPGPHVAVLSTDAPPREEEQETEDAVPPRQTTQREERDGVLAMGAADNAAMASTREKGVEEKEARGGDEEVEDIEEILLCKEEEVVANDILGYFFDDADSGDGGGGGCREGDAVQSQQYAAAKERPRDAPGCKKLAFAEVEEDGKGEGGMEFLNAKDEARATEPGAVKKSGSVHTAVSELPPLQEGKRAESSGDEGDCLALDELMPQLLRTLREAEVIFEE
jgi:hypothetical protein